MNNVNTFALGSAIYPAAASFIRDWYHSVKVQTDTEFELCIALDGITSAEVEEIAGESINAIWINVENGRSPAGVRQRLLEYMSTHHDGIILVDSDDVLHPQRVESAKSYLQSCDLNGCALRMVNKQGRNLGSSLTLPPETSEEDILPRYNIFGLSNTAWRSNLLQKCLPIPEEIELVDWYLATRAWLMNAQMTFDSIPRMDYRQYDLNAVTTCPPFTREQIIYDTKRVRNHFHRIKMTPLQAARPDCWQKLCEVAEDVEQFSRHIVSSEQKLNKYHDSLNTMEIQPLWWVSVAHPKLQNMWS